MHSRTLGQMLCNRGAAHGFGLRMARKPEKPAAVLQRNYDFAGRAVNLGDVAPGDADIQRAPEFQPATREEEMAILVGATASEADRRHEVALIAGRKRIGRFDQWQIAPTKTVSELGYLDCDCSLIGRMGTFHVNPNVTDTALPYRF